MNTTRRRGLRRGAGIVAVVVALLALTAACGGSGDSGSSSANKEAYAKTAYPKPDAGHPQGNGQQGPQHRG